MVMISSSRRFLKIALEYYKIAKDLEKSNSNSSIESLISIIFAHSYLEGYINDMVEFQAFELSTELDMLRNIWPIIERKRLIDKYEIVHISLTGKPTDKKQPPFQDFYMLNNLRNKIIHLEPIKGTIKERKVIFKTPKSIGYLKSKGIIPGDSSVIESWLAKIGTPKVAKWACETAIKVTNTIYEAIPDSLRKTKPKALFYVEENELPK